MIEIRAVDVIAAGATSQLDPDELEELAQALLEAAREKRASSARREDFGELDLVYATEASLAPWGERP